MRLNKKVTTFSLIGCILLSNGISFAEGINNSKDQTQKEQVEKKHT